jgi:hypothetical protein
MLCQQKDPLRQIAAARKRVYMYRLIASSSPSPVPPAKYCTRKGVDDSRGWIKKIWKHRITTVFLGDRMRI